MNDLQLYNIYRGIELPICSNWAKCKIYPRYVVITGRSFSPPSPCRHYTFDEFIDILYKDNEFRNLILNK